jgi:eukaryotic-like serine/threonine-protein kinase
MNFEIGSTIGDYQIAGMLGAGGMGKVYKVRNAISDRVEAMKVLLPDLAGEPELADRFVREIKVQASLEHPHIAALHTALRVENQLLMLMEFVEGETLDGRLKAGPLPVPEAVEYIAQALSALSYAHQRGVIHRDIKPANMMLTPKGAIKLMDFGIAKAATDRKLTMTGTTMGSLYYMSPEQIQGAATLDARSDLYSVGVSLYELVTGKRPFDGDSQFAIMAAHLEKAPVPPVTLDPRLPEELNEIILLSVAKDPNARFQTADAFRNALLSVQAAIGRPATAFAASGMGAAPPQRQQPAAAGIVAQADETRGKSRRGLWLAAGALCTALAVVAVIQFGPWKEAGAVGAPEAVPEPAAMAATAPAAVPEPVELPPAQVPEPVTTPPPAAPPQAAPVRQQAALPAVVKQRPAPAIQAAQPAAEPVQTAVPFSEPARVAAQPAAQPAPTPTAPAPAAAARPEELQKIREQLVMVSTRFATARGSLQNIQRSQAASGLGLRADVSGAASLAGTFLEGAKEALNDGNADAARGFLNKAERQVEIVEKFLGR